MSARNGFERLPDARRIASWVIDPRGFLLAFALIGAATIGYGVVHQSWVLVAAIVGGLLLLRWPIEVAFGSFIFLLPFDSINAIGNKPAGIPVTYFLGFVAALVSLVTALLHRRWEPPARATVWWALLIVWVAATYFWALEPALVAQRLPTALSLLAMFTVAISSRMTGSELNVISLAGIAGGVVASLFEVYEFFSGVTIVAGPQARASLMMRSSDTNPNVFAANLIIPLALALGWLLQTRRSAVRGLMMGAVIAIGFGLFLTMSRGALVAVGVMLLVFMWRMRVRARLLLPIVVLVACTVFLPQTFFYRVKTAVKDRGAGRLDIWTAGFAALERYGLAGSGLDNFALAYDQFAGRAAHYEGVGRDPHNVYLGLAVEAGIPGLLLFLAAVRSHLLEVKKLRTYLGGWVPLDVVSLEAACWAWLADSFFGTTEWRKAFWAAWMLLAISIRVAWRAANHQTHVAGDDDVAALHGAHSAPAIMHDRRARGERLWSEK